MDFYEIQDIVGISSVKKKLFIILSVAGHCRSSVIHYKHYTKKIIVTHFKNKNHPLFM